MRPVNIVMPGSRSSNDPEHKSPRESGEDSEDESEILEESPCGRWLKRREEVSWSTVLNSPKFLPFCVFLVFNNFWENKCNSFDVILFLYSQLV